MTASRLLRSARAKRVLVVEDDYFIAEEMRLALRNAGADVVGPAPSIEAALDLLQAQKIDVAVLDLNLDGRLSFLVADRLREAGVPFVFATGYDRSVVPPHFGSVPLFEKPFRAADVVRTLTNISLADAGRNAPPEAMANTLLGCLPLAFREDVRPHMSRVVLRERQIVLPRDRRISQVYFPEGGLCTLMAGGPHERVETGVVGREGLIGASLLLGVESTPLQCVVQVGGSAISVSADAFVTALDKHPQARSLLLKYLHALEVQVASTVHSRACLTVEQRLARWLLMCADRIGDEMPFVHEFLSNMLFVRRAGVTVALQSLEARGAISKRRGYVVIRDRQALEEACRSSYGQAEREYDSLFGKTWRFPHRQTALQADLSGPGGGF